MSVELNSLTQRYLQIQYFGRIDQIRQYKVQYRILKKSFIIYFMIASQFMSSQLFILYISYILIAFIIYFTLMDIQSIQGKSQRNRRNSQMESQQREDIFEHFLNLNINNSEPEARVDSDTPQSKTERKYNKRTDIRKILNSSSSNDRLLPSSLKHDSSRENSERARNNYQTENSMDEESVRQSFQKRHDQSFSVENTIRDSSSSFSQKSQRKSINQILPSQYREEEGIEIESKKFGCNCKKSKCLKLYCQCFQRQLYCNQNCKCYDCGNSNTNKQSHKKAVISALARNARGFQDQKKREEKHETHHQGFSLGVQIQQVRKGCKCRKTHCIKKYCECYLTGAYCGLFCRCQQCFNTAEDQNMRGTM